MWPFSRSGPWSGERAPASKRRRPLAAPTLALLGQLSRLAESRRPEDHEGLAPAGAFQFGHGRPALGVHFDSDGCGLEDRLTEPGGCPASSPL